MPRFLPVTRNQCRLGFRVRGHRTCRDPSVPTWTSFSPSLTDYQTSWLVPSPHRPDPRPGHSRPVTSVPRPGFPPRHPWFPPIRPPATTEKVSPSSPSTVLLYSTLPPDPAPTQGLRPQTDPKASAGVGPPPWSTDRAWVGRQGPGTRGRGRFPGRPCLDPLRFVLVLLLSLSRRRLAPSLPLCPPPSRSFFSFPSILFSFSFLPLLSLTLSPSFL